MSGGNGTLSFTVWPTYIGVATDRGTEPLGHRDYERGQIFWMPVDDERQVIGRARITCPPSTYCYFLYFHHPTVPSAIGLTPMRHPVKFTELVNVLDVDPILNNDLQLMHIDRG